MVATPAAAAQIIIAIIPIVGIVTGGVVVFFYLFWRHRQNLRMIEQGLAPRGGIGLRSFSLVAGLLSAGVGFVLSVFFVLTDGATYTLLGGLIPLAVGLGLLAFHLLAQMSHDDDAEAALRVLAGDTEAFAGIVRRNLGRLRALARRFFADPLDAEDFVQEVFLHAFRRLGTFRGESRFSSWLISLGYRLALRQRKRWRIDRPDGLVGDARADTAIALARARERGPEEQFLVEELRQEILDAMKKLPTRFAMCIDLYFFLGMEYQAISTCTSVPLNTVRSHIRRAKQLLREALISSDGGMP